MKPRLRPLKLAVGSTTALLLLGASLATLGAFDDALGWDIFPPQLEAVLRGVFAASMVLAAFGVGITMVLGIHSIASAIRSIADARDPGRAPAGDRPWRAYLRPMLGAAAVVVITVVTLSLVDQQVRRQRDEVFSGRVAEQMEHFGPLIAQQCAELSLAVGHEPPRAPGLAELVGSIESMPGVIEMDLMFTKSGESPIVWTLGLDHERRWRQDMSVATDDLQRAVVQAFEGEPGPLERLDAERLFVTYSVVHDPQDRPCAVVHIEASPHANFR